jgi:hypothetical protein
MHVWVGSVQTKHDTAFFAGATAAALERQIADYARDWWMELGVPGTYVGMADDAIIAAFFEYMGQFGDSGEYYAGGDAIFVCGMT